MKNETQSADHLLSTPRHGLLTGCRAQFACLAEFLEWWDSLSPFTVFKPAAANERVYFIGADDGPVKIGLSTSPQQRLESLQTGSSAPLSLLALVPGGRSLERAYHRHFEPYRVRGEWFDRCSDMEREIQFWSRKCRDTR